MKSPYFRNGYLAAPFYVFVKARLADADLLSRFGLDDYHPTTDDYLSHYALLADDGEWTMLADDWGYRLWNKKTTKPAIAELGRNFEVFACMAGDTDRSYEFVYYRGGQLARRYVVSGFETLVVEEDVGEALPAEYSGHYDEMDIVLGIAAALGIKTRYEEQEIRAYKPDRIRSPGDRMADLF